MNHLDYLPIIKELGFESIHQVDVLQILWGGYGELVRLSVDDSSIVIKHIRLPKPEHHPKGWNTNRSHQRKLHSYHVELNFYQDYANLCSSNSPVPKALLVKQHGSEWLLVMEDLHQLGYADVVEKAQSTHISASLRWLAYFHAQHIESSHEGLWDKGTYWHLDTRPDELEALADEDLRCAAQKIDKILTQAPYQTLVHGDAKLANFCFTSDGQLAAAVDFQYVGRGCAMKDVALFMSSAVSPEQCEKEENWILDEYFKHLKQALRLFRPDLDAKHIEQSWRPLFAIAWADFHRFVKGWSPEHWKINPYTEGLAVKALEQIKAYPDR